MADKWKKARKIVLWGLDRRLLAVLAGAAFVLLLVPLLRLALYSAPWYDDYNYGKFVKNFLDLEYSLGSALKGALYCTKTQWYAWQGTFSSIFFMSLMPGVWGEEYYFWGPIFLILILSISVWILTGVLLRDVLKADMVSSIPIQAIAAAMTVALIYTSQQGFFWFNAGVHYVGMHSFLLLLIAAYVKLMTGTGRVKAFFLILWTLAGAVLAGGANFVTTLQGLLVLLGIFALGMFLRRRHTLLLLPSLCFYAYSFYKNISAPGNNVRKAAFEGSGMGMDVVTAILHSFMEAFRNLWKFTGWITIAILILMAPMIWQLVKKTQFRFRYPLLILFGSFCLYATGFTPSLYVMGHAGISRTLNAVKISYQILLVMNEVYWIGWLCEKWKRSAKAVLSAGTIPILFYLAVGAWMLGIFFAEPNPIGTYSSFGAYYYVHTGEAYNFRQEYLERVEKIKNGDSEVIVNAYLYRPWMLSPGELSENPEEGANKAMAEWYGKQAIICVE